MSESSKVVKLTAKDLPASCPIKGTPAWDMHPRVYIEFNDEKTSVCPYCGNRFELVRD
jgi:uncharacterized Zn-finger protein